MSEDPGASYRSAVRDLVEAHPDGLTSGVLVEFGLVELLEDDQQTAVTAFFEETGRLAATTAGLAVLAAWTLGDGFTQAVPALAVRSDGLLLLPGPADPVGLLTVVDPAGGQVWTLEAPDAPVVAVRGIDPAAGLRRLDVHLPDTAVAPDRAARVIDHLLRAVAHQQVGVASRMLEIAVEHVSSRVQFGRPIGANQSVQHRLADVHVAVGAARNALAVSWEDSEPLAVAVAHDLALEASRTAIRHALQVCGGMGFTEEFPLAPAVRHSLLLARLFAGPIRVGRALAVRWNELGAVPRLGELSSQPL